MKFVILIIGIFYFVAKLFHCPKVKEEITNSINGRILAIYIDDKEYCYMEDFQGFMTKNTPEKFFSVFNDKLLFPEFAEDKLINIIYYTRDMAISVDDIEKSRLEFADDRSLIPEQFIEPILVYGTCLRLKGDPQHVKYNYWLGMYTSALAMMRSKIAVDAGYAPTVRIVRR